MLEFAYSSQKRFVRVEICPKKKNKLDNDQYVRFQNYICIHSLEKEVNAY